MGKFIKKSLLAGLLVTLPVAFTYIVLSFVIRKLDRLMAPLVREIIVRTGLPLPEDFHLPGLGFFLTCVFMLLVGLSAANLIGRRIVRLGERIMETIPLVRGVYTTIRQVFQAVTRSDGEAFERMVLVRYPHLSLHVMGLIACNSQGEIVARTRGDLVNVFVPMLPNVTLGWFLVVPREQVTVLEMTREDGIKMLLSFGIVEGRAPRRARGAEPAAG